MACFPFVSRSQQQQRYCRWSISRTVCPAQFQRFEEALHIKRILFVRAWKHGGINFLAEKTIWIIWRRRVFNLRSPSILAGFNSKTGLLVGGVGRRIYFCCCCVAALLKSPAVMQSLLAFCGRSLVTRVQFVPPFPRDSCLRLLLRFGFNTPYRVSRRLLFGLRVLMLPRFLL